MIRIPSQEEIIALEQQGKELDKVVETKIQALKVAMDECLEALNNREDVNLKMTMGKSTDQYYCLISDLEKLNSLIFSAFNHANLSNGYM